MKVERVASLLDASPRITPEAQTPAPGGRIASPEEGSEAATRAGFPRFEEGLMREASPIASASTHHPPAEHHLPAHHLASLPEPSAVELARATLTRLELPVRAYACLGCGRAADELTLFCPSCWGSRQERRTLPRLDSTGERSR